MAVLRLFPKKQRPLQQNSLPDPDEMYTREDVWKKVLVEKFSQFGIVSSFFENKAKRTNKYLVNNLFTKNLKKDVIKSDVFKKLKKSALAGGDSGKSRIEC